MINFTDNSTVIETESWFILLDTLLIITTSLTVILGVIFLLIAITHRTCWSVSMLLICNSCLAEVILSCVLLSMAIFTLQRDLEKNIGNLSICTIEIFLCYAFFIFQNYSYFLTAMYRYITVVYPGLVFLQSAKFQICLIIAQWIFGIVFPIPLLLTGQITYDISNQVCQVPLRLSAAIIYESIVIYMIPNLGIVIIYIKLARYVHQMSIRTIPNQTLFHARRELRLVQRTFILTSTLIILGLPYMIFILISFGTSIFKYHLRIAFLFMDISILIIMIMTYYFTQQIKDIIQKIFSNRNLVQPIRNTIRT